MRVAVLGAGNGGVAAAFDFAQHGHEVSLCATPEFGTNVVAVNEAGGIYASGDLEGFAPIRYSGHDHGEALEGAELVVLVAPTYGIEPHAKAAASYLTEVKSVLVCPGSCAGAIAFKRAAGLELDDERVDRGRDQHAAVRGARDRAGRHQRLPQAQDRRVSRGAPSQRHRPPVRPRQGRVARRREGRERLPDHAPERQPGHPPRGDAAQRRPARTHPRRLPVLRGGRDRGRRPDDRGGRQRAPRDRRRARRVDPVRARDRHPPGLHARAQLLHRLQHRARLPRHQGAEPARPPLPDRGRRLLAGLPRRPRRPPRASPPR